MSTSKIHNIKRLITPTKLRQQHQQNFDNNTNKTSTTTPTKLRQQHQQNFDTNKTSTPTTES